MKLSLLYTVWSGDDLEMLGRSVVHHLELGCIDEIYICYQSISNKGEKSNQTFGSKFGGLWKAPIGYIGYEPDLNISTKENERVKHNIMIQHAKKQGATHFIMAAADHFYDENVMRHGKNLMLMNDIDVILTKMITYYKHETWALEPLEDYYMPFIHKMYPNTVISKNEEYLFTVDPSVKVNTSNKQYIMNPAEGVLDHYSMVRKDIKKKFRNAAASIRWSAEQVKRFEEEYENAELGDKIEYFQNRVLVNAKELKNKVLTGKI